MKKITLLMLFTQLAFSQAPPLQWQKCIGGTGNDNIQSIRQTSDGGYIAGGYSSSTDESAIGNQGGNDILIIKLDSTGNIEWSKTYGGTNYDRLNKIIQLSDGSYIFTGFTYSNDGDVSGNHGDADAWVVKLNTTGDLVWKKTFGGTSQDVGNDIIEISDGYIVACNTYSNNGNVTGNHGTTDAWVLKLDFLGNLTWQKTFGGNNFDSAVSIQQTSDGGFAFTGTTNSNNANVSGNHAVNVFDYWVVKLSNTGTLQWQKCLGGTSADEANSIQQTSDDGYIVSGYTSSSNGDVTVFNGNKDYWLVKLNSTGIILWEKTLGGSEEDYSYKTIQTSEGGYIVTGYTGSSDGDVLFNHATSILTNDIWIIKLNDLGVEEWQKSLGSSGYQDSHDIQQTSDGGYVIAGNTGGGNNGDVTNFIGGNLDFWVAKLEPDNLSNNSFDRADITIYPNPVENYIHINYLDGTIKNAFLVDCQGRKINYNTFENKIEVTNLPSGLYLLGFETHKNEMIVKKIIKK